MKVSWTSTLTMYNKARRVQEIGFCGDGCTLVCPDPFLFKKQIGLTQDIVQPTCGSRLKTTSSVFSAFIQQFHMGHVPDSSFSSHPHSRGFCCFHSSLVLWPRFSWFGSGAGLRGALVGFFMGHEEGTGLSPNVLSGRRCCQSPAAQQWEHLWICGRASWWWPPPLGWVGGLRPRCCACPLWE
jgi:hypothetical protein